MQQTYRRTPKPNCDFNKVALQLCIYQITPLRSFVSFVSSSVNPLQPGITFLYPLKISENLKVVDNKLSIHFVEDKTKSILFTSKFKRKNTKKPHMKYGDM